MSTEIQIENNLFNERRMESYIQRYNDKLIINSIDKDPINIWLEKLEKNELENEVQNYLNFFEYILEGLLGYSATDIKHEENIEGNFVEFTLKKGEESFVIVELKGTTHKDLTKKMGLPLTPVQQATNYASAKRETKWAIVSNYDEFRFFDPSARDKYVSFKFEQLKDEKVLKQFLLIFSKFSLIDNDIPTKLLNETKVIERELEDGFYQLYSETRSMIIKELEYSEELSQLEIIRLAQLILNRYIFLCFAEDLLLIADQTTTKTISLHIDNGTTADYRIWNELNYLFKFANEGKESMGMPAFNGGLFEEDLGYLKIRDEIEDDSFFDNCRKDWTFDDKYEDIINDLGDYKDSLNSIYKNLLTISSFNFKSELDVNILGHIFENSISDIEELKDDNQNQQQNDGIYYTPEYITDYICRNAIIPYLSISGEAKNVDELINEYETNNSLDSLEEKLMDIKILDPACGSGSILNKSVDILLEIHEAHHASKFAGDSSLRRFYDTLEKRKEIISKNIYGVDLNEESVEITKLSLFLKLASSTTLKNDFKLPNLDNNIKCGNSIISDENLVGDKAFHWEIQFKEIFDNGGFDIVLGNPPYGAKLSDDEKEFLNERFIDGGSETAISFIKLSYDDLLKNNGKLSFIIPKSFAYASNYDSIRKYVLNYLETIIDCGQVWKDVRLEQIIIILNKNKKLDEYGSGTRYDETLPIDYYVKKDYYDEFNRILNGVNDTEINIAKKIKKSNIFLNDVSNNIPGAPFQKHASEKGEFRFIGGAQIHREGVIGIKRIEKKYIGNSDTVYIKDNSVLVQNVISHIKNPKDHIKITACIPQDKNLLICNTINQLIFNSDCNNYFFWVLLNSKLINWYAYRFIFAKSIRTMHFYNPTTEKIPIPIKHTIDHEEVQILSNKAENLNNNFLKLKNIKFKFFNRLYDHFDGININKNLSNYENLDFNKFNKQLQNQKFNLTLKKEEEWEDYFNYSKNDCLTVISEIETLIRDIDKLIYEFYDLSQDEIEVIENSF